MPRKNWDKRDKPLNERELRFIAAYNGENAGAAAIEAGYSKKHPRDAACRLLKDPRVFKAITEKNQQVLARVGQEQGDTIVTVAARHNITLDRLFGDYNNLLSSKKVAAGVKARCLEACCKMLGAMQDDRDTGDINDPMRWPAARLQAYLESGAWVPDVVKEAIIAERRGERPARLTGRVIMAAGDNPATPRPQQ